MTTNPFVNAVLAAGYIMLVVLAMQFLMGSTQEGAGEDIILIPIFMLSLFTLSAAVMGYLFFYQPFVLWFDGKRQEALTFFFKTVGAFALITLGIFSALLYII